MRLARAVAAFAGVTFVMCLAPVPAAAAILPAHVPPAGFRSFEGPQGGRALIGSLPEPFQSASEALRATLHRLRTYFSGPLSVQSAVVDAKGNRAIAFFTGTLGGVGVAGMAVVAANASRGAEAAALFDLPQRAGRTIPALLQALRGGGAGPASVPLQREQFADGSGSIGVPSGWHMIGGTRGMIDLVAADGAQAHISIMFPVWDPEVGGMADPRRMQLPFIADPVQAMLAVSHRAATTQNQTPPKYQILSSQPVKPPMGAGRAALIHGRSLGRQPWEFVALVNSAPLPGGLSWEYYFTALQAPPERFAADYPAMLAIWQSYRIDPRYAQQVQAQTAQLLSDAANIINGSTQRTIDAQDRTNAGLDYIITGQDILQTTADGTHWLGDAGTAQALVRKYPERYRILPSDEYRRGVDY